ncbi:MAG: LPS export ABC transporter ATP-binding protein [Candidatus Latescibacteria bacterium]|nr:LPS export ABC transporter ATP-binding protein [Candidatus Latescibacterota bacterium]
MTDEVKNEPLPEAYTDRESASENSIILRTENLIKKFKKRIVVNGVSISIKQGQIVGLLGPNGAGKTTTFRMVVGIYKPNKGKIFLDARDITKRPMYKRARLGINYLPQEPSIFRKMTVEENIMSILQTIRMKRKQRKERLNELLEELGVTHIRKSIAYTLSGGERRRVEIARALVTSPKFILLDEPFAGIDPIAVEDIQNIVAGLKDKGLGILITDHNVRETLAITDKAYIMADGVILTEGSSEFLANDPDARKIYLGERFRM